MAETPSSDPQLLPHRGFPCPICSYASRIRLNCTEWRHDLACLTLPQKPAQVAPFLFAQRTLLSDGHSFSSSTRSRGSASRTCCLISSAVDGGGSRTTSSISSGSTGAGWLFEPGPCSSELPLGRCVGVLAFDGASFVCERSSAIPCCSYQDQIVRFRMPEAPIRSAWSTGTFLHQ